MKHRSEDGKVHGVKLAYVGGGSRGWAWGLMGDLALEGAINGEIRLYDIDREAALQNESIGKRLFSSEKAVSQWEVRAFETLGEALEDADFVVISIQPATYREMASDVHEPEAYGIYQAVGDTVGPGGIVRGLRCYPMFEEIARSIKQHCPEAFVINYTNPMTICTRSLYRAFPEIKAFGCCHEVFGTQKLLASMLGEMKGIDPPDRKEIRSNVKGINHFTWIDEVTYQGIDLMPLYREFISLRGGEGFAEGDYQTSVFGNANLIKFDLMKRYGLIAAAGDRHLAEFCPPWYLKYPDTVKRYKFNLTPVSFRESEQEDRLERSRRYRTGEEEIPIKKSGEEGVNQMKALLGLGDLTTNVNLPNRGQISSLPREAVVETNAVFSHGCIRAVNAGPLPDRINALVYRHVVNQETVVEAAVRKDKELAFNAFANDPLVAISLSDARTLFEKMLYNTREYLKGFDLS